MMKNICLIGMNEEDVRATPLYHHSFLFFYEDVRAMPLYLKGFASKIYEIK